MNETAADMPQDKRSPVNDQEGTTLSDMSHFSILIAEDVDSVRQTVNDLLEIKGFAVTAVCDGDEAITKLEQRTFDIIILDINMPGMDGIEVLRRLRKAEIDSIVIIITAYGSTETATEALKLGAFDYVTKPFSSDTLYKIISNAVRRRKLEIENIFLRSTISLFDSTQDIVNSPEKVKRILKSVSSSLLAKSDSDEIFIYLTDQDDKRSLIERESHVRSLPPTTPSHRADMKKIRTMIDQQTEIILHGEETGSIFTVPPEKPLSSLMIIPLTHAQNLLGFIMFVSLDDNRKFSLEQKHPLEVFASYLSAVIENANLYNDMLSGFNQTIQGFVHALEAKDTYTKGHSERVTMYAVVTAREMGLSSDQIDILYKGGRLHDIGKIGLHYEKLNKPGKLTNEEWKMFREHPTIGKNIIKPVVFLRKVVPVIYQHHERWDGKGYPQGLSGTDIELEARILAIADTYDAMTSDRPYRKALSHQIAIDEVGNCSSSQFDPDIVPFFLEAIEKYRQKCRDLGLDCPK